jgi:hypothetical protein
MPASCGTPGHLAVLVDIPIEQSNLHDPQPQEHPYDSVRYNTDITISTSVPSELLNKSHKLR